jgi:hypothetical protein
MSIISLTDVEIKKLSRLQQPAAGLNAEDGDETKSPDNALSLLVKYIPTESVTIYVAALSAAPTLKNIRPGITEHSIYWFCGVLTPILFALIFYGKLKAAKLSLKSLGDWPWWKTFAATVAFLAWALAVPGEPDIKGDGSGVVSGLLALFISTMLSVLEPIFDRANDA